MRILVVGAGATGGYFGGRLAEAGRDVTFLVRPGKAAQLAADGLQIVSEHGDVTLQPQVVVTGRIDGTFDLILLSVKAYGLEQAMDDLTPALGGNTVILPTLNGMRHIELLVQRFGRNRVLGAVCVVSTTLDEKGRVVQLAPVQELSYGALDDADNSTEQVQAVDSTLHDAGFTARLTDGIVAAMWRKWMMLASVGAMNVLTGGSVGEVVAAPGGPAFARDLLDETSAVADAAGHPLSQESLQWISGMMTAPGSHFTTSLFRDMQAGLRVEVDAIIGDLVHRAEEFQVPTALLRLALTNLSVYESHLDRAP